MEKLVVSHNGKFKLKIGPNEYHEVIWILAAGYTRMWRSSCPMKWVYSASFSLRLRGLATNGEIHGREELRTGY
jgi:hypothetical protein